MAFSTILGFIETHALHQPDKPALVFLLGDERTVTLSYADLVTRAKSLAAHLKRSAASGDRALLAYGFEPAYLIAFFACLYAGIIAVPAFLPKANRKRFRVAGIVESARPGLVLSTQAALEKLLADGQAGAQYGACTFLATDALTDIPVADTVACPGDSSRIAFLQYTSGSTTAPRGVAISHANLLANLAMSACAFNVTAHTPLLGWTPLFHDFGLIFNVLQPLYVGATAVLLPPVQFLQKPVRWLQAISDYRAVISGGPNFAYDYCVRHISDEMMSGLDLAHWSIAVNAAEPVRSSTMERFIKKFAPAGFRRTAFSPGYGMAESTVFASAGMVGQGYRQRILHSDDLKENRIRTVDDGPAAKPVVSCGHARLAGEILIVDPHSRARLPADTAGEIWMRGPHIPAFYWNAPEASAAVFQGWLDSAGGPYLRTGDVGFQDRDGDLYVLGRLKDMLIIRGQNHYPQDIEHTAEGAHPALEPNACAAFPIDDGEEEQLVIAIELRRAEMRHADHAVVVKAIRAAISDIHDIAARHVVLVRPMALPKTSSDKIQRARCRQLFLDGALATLHVAGPDDASEGADCAIAAGGSGIHTGAIEAALLNQLAVALKRPLFPADAATTFPELGIDSLAMQEVLMDLNDRLGISVSITDVYEHSTVQLLALHAATLLTKRHPAESRS